MATFEEMEKEVQKKVKSINGRYIKIETEEEMRKIYNLWVLNIFQDPVTSNELHYFGRYYDDIKKDYEQAKKYYLMAIDLGNSNTMNSLGVYYHEIEKNYEQAKKYYLMATELGNSNAICCLGILYYEIYKDYEQAKKYYLMAMELGNSVATNNLGAYYYNIEKDYKQEKKYYRMAIELGNVMSMNNLAFHYQYKKKLTKALYYFSLSKNVTNIRKIFIKLMDEHLTLDKYFYQSLPHLKNIENLPEVTKLLISLYNKEVDILENAFSFAPGQPGYESALEDYHERLDSVLKKKS